MQKGSYDVAIWLRWPALAPASLACSELPRYAEGVEAYSHFDAAQRVMGKYGVQCAVHIAVSFHGEVKRWSFLKLAEDLEEQ